MASKNIDRYMIQHQLGRGGMATVHLAHDPHFKRDVAIKLLPRDLLHEATFKSRFTREAQTIAALEHPAIVPVYDFGEVDGQPYLVMRYMPGGSLSEKIGAGPLEIEQASDILNRLGSALDYAHSQGVVHRDLKPANILFDNFGNCYLADFGIARLAEASTTLTGTNAIIGTPAYMSPEQVHGDKVLDGRSDIYSLAIILFEMLTGKQPFEADTPAKVMMRHVLDPIPSIREVKPDLPLGSGRIFSTAMAKESSATRRPSSFHLNSKTLLVRPPNLTDKSTIHMWSQSKQSSNNHLDQSRKPKLSHFRLRPKCSPRLKQSPSDHESRIPFE
jgi:serine/threonine-protein kinase